MDRNKTLESAFLFEGFEVDGNQIKPLSANRRTFLRKMGNPLFGGDEEESSDDGELMAEALLACTKTPPELVSYLARKEQWKEDVASFAVTRDDYTIERFQSVVMDEIKALQASEVDPLGKDEAQPQAPA